MTFKLFIIALPVFFAIDMLWLGLVAKHFYRNQLGSMLRPDPNWVAAIVFYLLFIAGLVVFVVVPAVDAGSWSQAVMRGILYGLVTYATYDLTNLATLENWPLKMTIVDLVWGMTLAGSVSATTYAIWSRIGS